MRDLRSLYEILELTPKATAVEIRIRAQKLLAELADEPPSRAVEYRRKIIRQAYDTLANSAKRAAYDRTLAEAAGERAEVEMPGWPKWVAAGAVLLIVWGAYEQFLARPPAPVTTAQASSAPAARPAASSTAAASTGTKSTGIPVLSPAEQMARAIVPTAPPDASLSAASPAEDGVRELTAADLFRANSPSIVVVVGLGDGGRTVTQGSGVVIGDEQVVTNCHVAMPAKELKVKQDGQAYSARLRFRDFGHDLCQLTVAGLVTRSVRLAGINSVATGDKVYAIGAPQGLELSLSEGIVSSLRTFEGSKLIQTTAAISPGSSGGGLFDRQGRLVGITTFQARSGQNLNFAVPADWITQLPGRDGHTDHSLSEALSSGGLGGSAAVPG